MISIDIVLERYRVKDAPLCFERRIELCLIFFLAILCIQIIVGAFQIFADSSPKPKPPLSEILEVISAVDNADISPDLLRELIERPLFWETRKREAIDLEPKPQVVEEKQSPKPKVVAAAPKPPKKISQHVNVVGIFGGGDTGGAILNMDGKEVRLLIGESILDGWTLSEVDEEKVVFTYGSHKDDRHLRRANPLACKMDPSICRKKSNFVSEITVGSWAK